MIKKLYLKEMIAKSFLLDKYLDSIITQEIKDWYYKRTNNHIKLVQKYCQKIYDSYCLTFPEIVTYGNTHDQSKLKDPEIKPYTLITWNYYCNNNKLPFDTSDFKEEMNKAAEYHILNNPHHPEYWQDEKENLINKDDRDKNLTTIDSKTGKTFYTKIIDATKMPDIHIAEMCADWAAMSEERGNTPFEWAEKVINKRWKFTDKQIQLIYEILNKIWR